MLYVSIVCGLFVFVLDDCFVVCWILLFAWFCLPVVVTWYWFAIAVTIACRVCLFCCFVIIMVCVCFACLFGY